MMRKFTSKANCYLALALALVLLVGTLAFFSDRVTADATVSTIAHAVDIEPDPDPTVEPDDPTKPDPEDYEDPTPNDPDDDLSNWWVYLNSRAMANYNPGDKMTLNYILSNKGTLAVDIRETFVITSGRAMNASDPEFALYKSFTQDANGCNFGTNAVPVTQKISNSQYKYVITGTTLSGSKETVPSATAKSTPKSYYVVFDADANNTFQGVTCTVDYVVEAKQHGSDEWTTIKTESLTLNGHTINAVPAA